MVVVLIEVHMDFNYTLPTVQLLGWLGLFWELAVLQDWFTLDFVDFKFFLVLGYTFSQGVGDLQVAVTPIQTL